MTRWASHQTSSLVSPAADLYRTRGALCPLALGGIALTKLRLAKRIIDDERTESIRGGR